MKIALVGQPNAGKSTLFNSVAGYKSATSNLPGTTVNYTESRVHVNGNVYDLIDFPGTYSLSATNEAEAEVRKYLLTGHFDLIINVVDASQLGRSLPLTLELMELNIPVLMALNMVDEAKRKGIQIDTEKLSRLLGIPVQTTIASKNIGVRELFLHAKNIINGQEPVRQKRILCQRDVEAVIEEMEAFLKKHLPEKIDFPLRFLAIKLLEDDDYFLKTIQDIDGKPILRKARELQKKLVKLRGKPQDSVLTLERHAIAMDIYEQVVTIGHPRRDIRDWVDNIIMHRILGYVILVLVLASFFVVVFKLGGILEEYLLFGFEYLENNLLSIAPGDSLLHHLLKSTLWGISGGVAIVLPYLVPFLIGLNLLEDIGYLPRVAFLMDAFMHRIGLHGTAIVPAVLGYGCNVPAVMATRILPDRRDKIIAAIISSMVPCSARSVVIFGLVAFYLGPLWALAIYVLNIFVIAMTGKILTRMMPEVSPGMVLEIPPYRLPSFQVVKKKTWFRIKEFIYVAWPLLIAGSIVLGLLEYFHLDEWINLGLSPLTSLLGLPVVVGTTLIFGVLRKELSLIMLTQALGTTQVISVMSTNQILTFTIFITFYIPCVATIAVLKRELGGKWMLFTVALTFAIATVLGWLVHVLGFLG
jgi:ferrous iron transport protein B